MNYLKNLFKVKDKKKFNMLLSILAVGIILLIFSSMTANSLKKATTQANNATNKNQSSKSTNNLATADETENNSSQQYVDAYKKSIESQLEETLSQVAGAGDVKVMLTMSQSKESIVQTNKNQTDSTTEETDGTSGGKRTLSNNSLQETTVMIKNSDGSESPLVLVENQPKVEGVIILAKGGDKVTVKSSLIKATEAIFGIEITKIEVLKMK